VPLRGSRLFVVAEFNHNIDECLLEELDVMLLQEGINHNIEECLLEE
jgi:hypothetical protein